MGGKLKIECAGGPLMLLTNHSVFSRNLIELQKHPSLLKAMFQNKLPDKFFLLSGVFQVLSEAFYIGGALFKTFATIPQFFRDTIYLPQKTHHECKNLFEAYRTIKEIEKTTNPNEKSLIKEPIIKALITQLNTRTYKDCNGSYFYNPLTLYKTESILAKEETRNFIKKIYAEIGFYDAISHFAIFAQQHNCTPAEYIHAKKPLLLIANGKNPQSNNIIDQVSNNFNISEGDASRPCIISGKNGSGKSFNIRMAFINVWLAQTFGFTLTNGLKITPFNLLSLHANISDSDHHSKFQTEKNAVAHLVKKLSEAEEHGKKVLVVFDEPFSTTSSVYAEPILEAMVKVFQRCPSSIIIIMTHLHNILKLKDTKQLISTRKFQEGPSFDNDAAEIIADALPESLKNVFLVKYQKLIAKNKKSLA